MNKIEQECSIEYYRSFENAYLNCAPTACKVLHKPTGVFVTSEVGKTQFQNKEYAMQILISKLLEIKQEEHEKKLAELKGENFDINFGSQIRSYVFHPYKMVCSPCTS